MLTPNYKTVKMKIFRIYFRVYGNYDIHFLEHSSFFKNYDPNSLAFQEIKRNFAESKQWRIYKYEISDRNTDF